MQDQFILQLKSEIDTLKSKVAILERQQISIFTDPKITRALLAITKDQFVVSATPTFDAPTGSIAIKPTATKTIWVREPTAWTQIVP